MNKARPFQNAAQAAKALRALASPQKAAILQRFFKTGPGEYGEGDQFIGVTVPAARRVAATFSGLSQRDVSRLARSPVHEERLLGLLIWMRQFSRADPKGRKLIYDLYVRHMPWINNWDLVDISCRDIIGGWLASRSREPLHRWARSKRLWDRRVAIVSTWPFIRDGDVQETLHLALVLLHDKEDLIHKAVGWMLRELGKRDERALRAFLDRHAASMPRTMLRYAIERFPPAQRRRWMGLAP